jgi:hypothetical protein
MSAPLKLLLYNEADPDANIEVDKIAKNLFVLFTMQK